MWKDRGIIPEQKLSFFCGIGFIVALGFEYLADPEQLYLYKFAVSTTLIVGLAAIIGLVATLIMVSMIFLKIALGSKLIILI